MLYPLIGIEKSADRSVVVEGIDQEGNVFAHVTVDIVGPGEELWRLID